MKNLKITKLFLIFLVGFTMLFTSCKKESVDPKANYKYIDFKDLSLMEQNTEWNPKEEGINTFKSGVATFFHKGNNTPYGWNNLGCFYSNRTTYEFDKIEYQANSLAPEYQYTSACKKGVDSEIYVVYNSLDTTIIKFDNPINLKSMHITNNAYAYCSMSFGDSFTKKFGEEDWFKAIVISYDENKKEIGKKDIFLAQNGIILKDWKEFNFNFLKKTSYIKISFDSSDKGDWGINTPRYLSIGKISYEN